MRGEDIFVSLFGCFVNPALENTAQDLRTHGEDNAKYRLLSTPISCLVQ